MPLVHEKRWRLQRVPRHSVATRLLSAAGSLLTAKVCAHDGVKPVQLWITSGAATTSACTRRGSPKAVKFSLRDLFEGKPTRTAPHGAKREERKRRGSPYLRAISSRRKTALAACPPGPDVGPKRPNEGWTAVTGSVVIRRPERRSTGSRGDGGPAGCSAAPTRTRRGGPGPGSRGPVQQALGRGRWRGPGGSPRREPRSG